MISKIAGLLFASTLVCGSILAQESPKPSPLAHPSEAAKKDDTAIAPDAAELTKLLNDFLAGASRNDVEMHDRFWAADLIYTGSGGRRIGKTDIMSDVRKEAETPAAPDAESSVFTAEDIRIQQYGDTAIVAFRLVGTTKKGAATEVANYLNTGTFLKRDGKWQAVSWQATKMPADSETKK
ncbi:MAG: nuclear transport factor 2 family protein [Chthoniobacterales bacterium]